MAETKKATVSVSASGLITINLSHASPGRLVDRLQDVLLGYGYEVKVVDGATEAPASLAGTPSREILRTPGVDA